MPYPTKIATCSYCGARTMLRPTARQGHELACASCGAPLHEMKWLKAPDGDRAVKPSRPMPVPGSRARWVPDEEYRRPKKRKKRKSFWREALEEAADFVEDIFD